MKRKIIALIAVLMVMPAMNARNRIEINAGISTTGITPWNDYQRNRNNTKYHLSDIDYESRDIELKPAFSLEGVMDLTDHGFFKDFCAVGYLGYGSFGFTKTNPIDRTIQYSGTVSHFDILVGARYHVLDRQSLRMYAQVMAGAVITDGNRFWERNISYVNPNLAYQITWLGMEYDIFPSTTLSLELGSGTEYAFSNMIIVPGLRIGIGYNF